MNVFLSKYTNQFYAYIVKYVYQITNKLLEGIFLLFFYLELLHKARILCIWKHEGKHILEEFWGIIRH